MDISVFITSYNQKAYLKEAIESVLAQTLPARQVVIVDDCSDDGSQALIEGYQSRYPEIITPILHEQNLGVAQARANALRAVSGTYVTYLDGDDRYMPKKLEKESALLLNRTWAQIAYSNSFYMTEEGEHFATWVTDGKAPQGDAFVRTLTRDFPQGNLFRMELLPYALWRKVGFHDPNLKVLEDWEMRIRLTRKYRLAYWDEPLSEIRMHSSGLSSLAAAEKLKAFDYIWRKHEPALDSMNPAARRVVMAKMDRLRAEFMRREAKEALGAYGSSAPPSRSAAWNRYKQSWRHCPYLDLDLLAGLLLPIPLYLRLRKHARKRMGRPDRP